MKQDHQTTSTDDRVIVPVAPERSTGMQGAPIIIDLRSSRARAVSNSVADIPREPQASTMGNRAVTHAAHATDATHAAGVQSLDTPARKETYSAPSMTQPHSELQLVTVEDLTASTRALRRENAQLTAMINTMRAEASAALAARDQLLVDAERASQQALTLASNQLAAAHMQIEFSSPDAHDGSPPPVDLVQLQETHEADRAALIAEIERLAALHDAASDERTALQQQLDDSNDERESLQQQLDDSNDERESLRQQLDDSNDERESLRQRLDASTESDTSVADLRALASERDGLQDERDALAAKLQEGTTQLTELQAQLHEITSTKKALAETLDDLVVERDGLDETLRDLRATHQDETVRATTQMHAALAERDRERAIALHAHDSELKIARQQLEHTRIELSRAHEALASLTEQDHASKVDELTVELATARADLDQVSIQLASAQTDVDERVQRAFEAGSQLGERAAERLARLLPADSH